MLLESCFENIFLSLDGVGQITCSMLQRQASGLTRKCRESLPKDKHGSVFISIKFNRDKKPLQSEITSQMMQPNWDFNSFTIPSPFIYLLIAWLYPVKTPTYPYGYLTFTNIIYGIFTPGKLWKYFIRSWELGVPKG